MIMKKQELVRQCSLRNVKTISKLNNLKTRCSRIVNGSGRFVSLLEQQSQIVVTDLDFFLQRWIANLNKQTNFAPSDYETRTWNSV